MKSDLVHKNPLLVSKFSMVDSMVIAVAHRRLSCCFLAFLVIAFPSLVSGQQDFCANGTLIADGVFSCEMAVSNLLVEAGLGPLASNVTAAPGTDTSATGCCTKLSLVSLYR